MPPLGEHLLEPDEPDRASDLIERFNAFHDGFIKRLSLESRDRFSKVGPELHAIGHEVTGAFDAVVEFAHYNYGETLEPPQRVVRGRFEGVRDFRLDLRGWGASDWPIQYVAIEPARRDAGEGGDEPCFRLSVTWSHLNGNEWTHRTAELFTFRRARFDEFDAP